MRRCHLLLLSAMVVFGIGCSDTLFDPITCEETSDCVGPCEVVCTSFGEVVMSNECDANGFCDCLCEPASTD